MLVYVYVQELGHFSPCPYSDTDDDIPVGETGCTCGDAKVSKTVEVEGSEGQITIDYNAAGGVVGVEVLMAKRVTTEEN